MATAAQKASAGVYVTDDIGLEVTDGSNSRVQLGLLPSGSYGLRVVSSDGTTVIIDGTSDMFKIAASGSQSGVVTAGNTVWTSTTLSGLGSAYTATPALLAMVAVDNLNPGTSRAPSAYIAPAAAYCAITSGGAVTTRFVGSPFVCESAMVLSASPGTPEVQVGLCNMDTASHTAYQYYYVLSEVSF